MKAIDDAIEVYHNLDNQPEGAFDVSHFAFLPTGILEEVHFMRRQFDCIL